MELFGTIIHIHQEKIVHQKILEKVIAVKALLIRHNELLNLTHRYLSNHMRLIAVPSRRQDIGKFSLIHDLKQMILPNRLTTGRRIGESSDQLSRYHIPLKGRCNFRPIQIIYCQINLRESAQLLNAVFYYLCCNHPFTPLPNLNTVYQTMPSHCNKLIGSFLPLGGEMPNRRQAGFRRGRGMACFG
ncbi:hypothetical protein IMSAGC003_02639 [Lachnospiraceae bacterium]|nr:hypothetical protein IMSAGC003_02639 [Lachnospiraceae bacterium]